MVLFRRVVSFATSTDLPANCTGFAGPNGENGLGNQQATSRGVGKRGKSDK